MPICKPSSLRDLTDAGLRKGAFSASGAHLLGVRSVETRRKTRFKVIGSKRTEGNHTHARYGLSHICNGLWRVFLVGSLSCISHSAWALDSASTPPVNARAKAQQQGDAAMERAKDAIARQKVEAEPGPTTLPALPNEAQRRAFDGLHQHVPSPAMEARARAAYDKGKDGFAAQRAAMAKRLHQALGLDAPEMEAVAKAAATDPAHAWVPVLFVSSSMPLAELRTYAGQLEQAGGVMAFRGMSGGLTRVGPMAKLSAEILRINPDCEGPACVMRNLELIVDPLVFRQHGVTAVPALAMIPGDPTRPYCERDETSPTASHIVYGDAALSGMLDEYARLGGREEVRDAQARLERR